MTLPPFLTDPQPAPVLFPTARRAAQAAILEAQTRPVPAAITETLSLRSQVRQLSDDDFRALVVAEATARGMTDLWRVLP